MADYTAIKNLITEVVKTNGAQEITGANLQNVLISMINAINSANLSDFEIVDQYLNGLSERIDTDIEAVTDEIQGLSERLDANRFGYNVTVFGLITGEHTLQSAISNVPTNERFGGQKVTFYSSAGWVTYQNISLSAANYENVNNWVLDSGVNVEGDVTITNNPDYEDLTQNQQNQLKFADKEYSAATFSGLGRVYLRKNIVSNKNVLTQAMLADENTIYIIQYDYDLDGASVTIPANCVLKFEGGRLINGGIIGQDTEIQAASTIFSQMSIIQTKVCRISWVSNTLLSNIQSKEIVIDDDFVLNETWQLHPNQKIKMLADINVKKLGQIRLNLGNEINGHGHIITITESEQIDATTYKIQDAIVIDGDIITPALTELYGASAFHCRARISIHDLGITIDESLAYQKSRNNKAAAILITASGNNWVWGTTIYNVSISGNFLTAVHVQANGTSWIHDVYINNLLNERTLNRLLVDSADEVIQNTGVSVYDSNGSMQSDHYLSPFWNYTPQRLVRMSTGIVYMDNVFAWDWILTTDAGGNPVDGHVQQDYIYEGTGGALHINNAYYLENVKNGLYNISSERVTGTAAFLENCTYKSNRVVTESLNKEKENKLFTNFVNNTYGGYVEWGGFLKYTAIAIRLPFGITYNNTIAYPRFVELGYFMYDYTNTFDLRLRIDDGNLHLFGTISSGNIALSTDIYADGFCQSLKWAYYKDGNKFHFGFLLQQKNLNLSSYSFMIEDAQSFNLNLNSIGVDSIDPTTILFNRKKQDTTRPNLPAVGDMYFDETANKPIWCKTIAQRGRLTITVSSVNSSTGTLVIEINGENYSIPIDQIYTTQLEMANAIRQQMQRYGFTEYVTANNYTILSLPSRIESHQVVSNDTGATISTGINYQFADAIWVDATGTTV